MAQSGGKPARRAGRCRRSGELAAAKAPAGGRAKAGEAGEPVLSIQLYARLLARYPESAFAAQARAAVEAQKQKLAKP